MRAWILDECPGQYRFGEVDTPEPRRGQVRVRLVASALNHMDLWVTRGLPRPPLPHVPGADGAGVVDAVGEDVTRVSVGDEVVVEPSVSCGWCSACLAGDHPLCPRFHLIGEHVWGMHAEHVVVPDVNVVPRPPSRSWAEAAAFGLVTVTAWRMLKRARLQAGETMLVVGAGGGVSSAGLVLGKAMGAIVYATSRDEAKRKHAIALGAVNAFDSDADFPVKADVVFENVGPATWDRAVKALKPGGRLVTCGGTSGTKVEVSIPRLFFKQHEIIGSTMGSHREFEEVTALVANGLPVVVDTVYEGLESFPDALARLDAAEQFGKVVVRH